MQHKRITGNSIDAGSSSQKSEVFQGSKPQSSQQHQRNYSELNSDYADYEVKGAQMFDKQYGAG